MAAPQKLKQVEALKDILSERGNFILTTYAGLTVSEIGDLRSQVRAKNARFKVVKNRLFKRALSEAGGYDGESVVEPTAQALVGPVAVAFAGSELPAVAKLIVEFGKKNDKVAIKAGCLEGQFLDEAGVKGIADLPTREELLAIIGRGLNTPAQKIAFGMKEIISRLARGIDEVGKKNG